ncbi:MAG TPA: hypothetical protein VFY87_22290 [Geminicoccaceae bacterium]|nr:hypothetical protein [Geminicoccaceae bacterium]
MKYARHGPAALLLLGALGLAPKPAQASDLDFKVTTSDSTGACILLQGPWFRDSGFVRLTNNTDVVVYSAEINLFSPFGEWVVSRFIGCDPLKRNQREVFCVDRAPAQLTVANGVIVSQSLPRWGGDPAVVGAQAIGAAYLGDEPARPAAPAAAQATAAATAAAAPGAPALGGDHFRFEGQAGDTVELVLDRDGARGSDGELARLGLRGERGAPWASARAPCRWSPPPRCRRWGST